MSHASLSQNVVFIKVLYQYSVFHIKTKYDANCIGICGLGMLEGVRD